MKRCCPLALLLVFFLAALSVSAQDFPDRLLRALPAAAEKLGSDDVRERASILRDLVSPVPMSCTLELALPFKDLQKEDYAFVAAKILEKDLRLLDEKTAGNEWRFLTHLIGKFEMTQFAPALAVYLERGRLEPEKDGVRHMVIEALWQLKATEYDYLIVQYVNLPNLSYLVREVLISFRSKKVVPALIEKLSEPNSTMWAIDKLAEIGAVEAGPQIAEVLKSEDENMPYWAIDGLARLNAKAQAKDLWQFLRYGKNERFKGYATAALIQFGEKAAVTIAIDQLKAMAQGSENYYTWEFINKLKPKFLIPALISLYNTKPRFLADEAHEKRFRWQIYQQLVNYRTPLAIPIYREHLVDKHFGEDSTAWRPNNFTADLLFDLGATEALDDIIRVFIDANKPEAHPDARTGAWELSTIVAKFGDRKTWKMLVDYAEKTDYWGRNRIIQELNKQADRKLWDLSHSRIPKMVGAAPVETVAAKVGDETGVPIVLEYVPKKAPGICAPENFAETDGYPCGYASGSDSLYNVVAILVEMLNYQKRGEYTFILDNGTIRILKTDKAIEWWRKNKLSNIN